MPHGKFTPVTTEKQNSFIGSLREIPQMEFYEQKRDRLLNVLATTNKLSLKFHNAAVELAELQKNHEK